MLYHDALCAEHVAYKKQVFNGRKVLNTPEMTKMTFSLNNTNRRIRSRGINALTAGGPHDVLAFPVIKTINRGSNRHFTQQNYSNKLYLFPHPSNALCIYIYIYIYMYTLRTPRPKKTTSKRSII